MEAKITRDPHTPDRRPGRRRARRRRADRHAILASVLAVLALVGCVVAILMLATQPTAVRLEREIGSLNRRLAADQGQLASLRAAVDRAGAKGWDHLFGVWPGEKRQEESQAAEAVGR